MTSEQSSFRVDSSNITERIKKLIHEGNIRRITIKHEDNVIAEFPLTAAVLGATFAPALAAIGAIVALVNECTIEVEQAKEDEKA